MFSSLKNFANTVENQFTSIQIKNNFKLEVEIEMMKITNLRLENLIKFLKNANIINLRRKIIEVLIFLLMNNNIEFFNLPKDYNPSKTDLDNLEILINNKINESNRQLIEKDLEKLENEKKKFKEDNLTNNRNDNIIVNEKKKHQNINKEILILKDFLEYYKASLHPFVHINKNTSSYYILPRKLFNTDIESLKYLYDLENILGFDNKSSKNNKDYKIYLREKKSEEKNNIYIKKKILSIDEISKLLFSFDEEFKLNDKIMNDLEEKGNQFLKDINEKANKFNSFFNFKNILNNNDKLCLQEIILNESKKIVDFFSDNVLDKIFYFYENLFVKNMDDIDNEIISKICVFIFDFINGCKVGPFNYTKFLDSCPNKVLIVLAAKYNILNKIYEFVNNRREIFEKSIVAKKEEFLKYLTGIKSSLIKLKNIKNSFEEINIYNNYINNLRKKQYKYYFTHKSDYSTENIIKYLKKYINDPVNIEMNYTYDSKFCLWAIKRGFAQYFE